MNYMMQEFGTRCLITDYASEKYLSKNTYQVPKNRLSKWCGGKGGFDDFVERWHV